MGIPEDAYASLNPYTALSQAPSGGLGQIFLTIAALETFRLKNVLSEKTAVGDCGLGQNGWNPFNFKYDEKEYAEKQLQEIKHGRLAMFGIVGILIQAKKTGLGITEQLDQALAMPAAREFLAGPGNMNDYFPPNI